MASSPDASPSPTDSSPPADSDSSSSPPSPPSKSPPARNSPPSPPGGNQSQSPESSPLPPQPPPPPPPPPPSQNSSNSSNPSPPPPPSQQDNGGRRSSPPSRSSAPPPPAPSGGNSRSPPSSDSGGPNSRNSPSDGGGGTDPKIIAGVAIGVGVVIILMIIVCVRRRKKRKDEFYGDSMKGNHHQYYDSSQYNNGSQQYPNWHLKPQGTTQQPSGGGGGWGAPPPPTMGTSGEDSSMYSGPPRPVLPPPSPNIALGFNKSTFTYEELAAATGGFAQSNLLGQGGFGYVHKGVLPSGKEIAVKSLKSGSGQGEREFQAEVDIISRVHHRYLVSLVGYCIAGGQRMLVYEFVPNNTLEHHLHEKGLPVMDFPTRVRIALGSAKGLAYLHEDCHPRIIHRDIKSANILLDFAFEAQVADFGLAKLSSDNYTHVSTRVMGTFGYLAPEYASSGKLTEKSDVFSFGIMLLELITGRRPVDNSFSAMEDSLVDWARPLMTTSLGDGNFDELADPRLEGNYNTQEMARMVTCAAASIRHSARKRPKMSQIVRALEGDVSLDDLNEGIKPGQSSIYTSSGSSDYGQTSYQADMKKFRQIALSSTEFQSSSEYGTSSNESREMTTPSRNNPKSPSPNH